MFTKPNKCFLIRTLEVDKDTTTRHGSFTENFEDVAKVFFRKEVLAIEVAMGSYKWTWSRDSHKRWMKLEKGNRLFEFLNDELNF